MNVKVSNWSKGTGSSTRADGEFGTMTKPPIQPSALSTATSADTYTSSYESATTAKVDLTGSGKKASQK